MLDRKRLIKARDRNAQKNQLLNDGDLLVLKRIVDENPNYYLDEFAFQFGMITGTFVHHSKIRRCLVERLGYSLEVLKTIAKQKCE